MIDATGEEEGETKCDGDDKSSDNSKYPAGAGAVGAQENKGKFTNEQVVMMAIGFLLAGYETTANALAYTSYLLALHPDIQEKLQSEIDSYFDEKPVSIENILYL